MEEQPTKQEIFIDVSSDSIENDEAEETVKTFPAMSESAADPKDEKKTFPTDASVVIDADLVEIELKDMEGLRRVSDSIPMAAFLIVLVEFCERFAYYGLSGPWTNYIRSPLPEGSTTGAPLDPSDGTVAGALGKGQQTSTGLVQFFSMWCYLTPIFAAMIADTKLGKFKTICISSVIYLIGILVLVLTSIPPALAQDDVAFIGLIVSMIIIGVGAGGIKANVSVLVAEQYTNTKPRIKVLPSGEKVVVDPNVTIQRIFNWFYLMVNIGGLSPIATTSAEKYVGFWLAYTIPAVLFLGAPFVLWLGRNRYVIQPPRGSVLMEAFRVWRITFSWNPRVWFDKKIDRYEEAKPSFILSNTQKRPSWLTWDDEFVDELKRTAAACKVFLFYPIYWIAYGQMNSNLVSQAATMQTGNVPNDLLNNFDPITVIILIPVMDVLIYPALRKYNISFAPMKRITLGFIFAAVGMGYAAVLQWYIYKQSACGDYAGDCETPAPINVWIQIPAYVLIALSEIFASITGLEYAYNKAPTRLKSLVMSIFLLMSAFGSLLCLAIVPVSEDPYLFWNYVGVGIGIFITGIIFYVVFRKRDLNEEAENMIGKDRKE